MKIADMLNPSSVAGQLSSPPLSPEQNDYLSSQNDSQNNGKPRSRFSDIEDAIICEGVAKGLTWGQISGQLPHRKRATCFNRYRTLQGVRKSRKRSVPELIKTPPITPPYSSWLSSPKQHQMPSLVAPLPRLSSFLYDCIR
ncbi:hypothetical protein K501DRAFT_334287 [Backusella circina FSU 941]|nr:hypothetical protein K501DRAFT_334287 [Backusella circina FSU 941]